MVDIIDKLPGSTSIPVRSVSPGEQSGTLVKDVADKSIRKEALGPKECKT